MDTVLVVVYSLTGTSRRVADRICAQQGWPMGVVTDRRARTGATGALRCVLDSLLRRSPPILYDGPDPRDFHTVLLVAPVWTYRLAAPMRSFLARHRDEIRHTAVVMTMGSAGAAHAWLEVEQVLGRPPVLKAAFRAADVLSGAADGPALEFAEALRGPPRSAWGAGQEPGLRAVGQ